MKFSIVNFLKGNAFHVLQDDVAILRGKITRYDLTCMKSWIRSLEIGEQAGTLLIDSEGGLSDPELLASIVRVPLHTHVLRNAQSFAALIALCGSYKTATEDAVFMVHASRWDMTKTSEEVARDQKIMNTHNYRTMAIMGSVLPAGDAKDQISKAMCSDTDVYLDPIRLYETAVLDNVADFMPKLKDIDVLEWLRRKYD